MTTQLDLFSAVYSPAQTVSVFNDEGGRVWNTGDFCDFHASITVTLENGDKYYAYGERFQLVEKRENNIWLCILDMGLVWGKTWSKNGTRALIAEDDMSEADTDRPCWAHSYDYYGEQI